MVEKREHTRDCFAVVTPMLTPEGSKAIEEIVVGDLVLARDESDPKGVVQARVVEEVFVRTDRVLELRMKGRRIRTTRRHPFFVKDKGWVNAGGLVPGNRLSTHEGHWIAVEGVEDTNKDTTDYNVRVAKSHTYFLGCPEWGWSVWAHNRYSSRVEDQLKQDIDGAIPGDHDARNAILKPGRNADVPEHLGDAWGWSWTVAELQRLAGMNQAQRQDHIFARMRAFMHDDPINRRTRVNEAATQQGDADLRLQGQIAQVLLGDVVAFHAEVLERTQSSFTGKVKYTTLTDIDVETSQAIIEVTTQQRASGKVGQLQALLGNVANPQGKPVFHLMPNADAGAIAALRAAGSSGVFRSIADLYTAIQALP
jgi:hypothetical protein